ncbi:hypothetical protein B0H67DRAFT_491402 [Lasiosphaeris hirsuta]|uniref:Uncharacterized protein n=1 Tax=Lasiosphaeris hirsuta TaxID=260670 RepID=A0AA40DPP6_9PEZI|nr:hypothetical protein B0H67DRAFT_491402 [Lasiosphaeris hirsuta]
MTIPRLLPAGLGTLAILPTTAILVIHIILAQSLADPSPSSAVRITAIIAALLEIVLLFGLAAFTCSYLSSWGRVAFLRRFDGVWFGGALFLCAVATAVSVSNLVCLSNPAADLPSTILGSRVTNFLVGSSVTLGLAFATQLVFLVFHFIATRFHGDVERVSAHTPVDERRMPQHHQVKSIPYHQTTPRGARMRPAMSMESKNPPGSSGGRSATETMSSIRSSLSSVLRPTSSRTRLLPSSSQRSSRRPASLDSIQIHLHEQQSRNTEDGFDSWDTSAVDPQNRQTVLESSSPPLGRFLETIPASPTTSRSPSPGTPLDLQPPRMRRRSRSYSPGPMRAGQDQRAAFTQQSTQSESHIHPLFRSDSPTPPSIMTPGTVVTAAPNAGQVISDRASIRTLTRMRSGSLPTVPSPLSRQGSFDSFQRRPATSSSPELREEDELETDDTERKMTPPLPHWVLSAGSRTSLSSYHSRRIRVSDEEEARGRGLI